jgi:hypothetical protein
MSLLRPLESFVGMCHGLLGMLVSGLVFFFPVVHGGSTVRVCGEFVEFSSFLVRVSWHRVSHPPRSLHLRIFAFPRRPNYVHSRRSHPGAASILLVIYSLCALGTTPPIAKEGFENLTAKPRSHKSTSFSGPSRLSYELLRVRSRSLAFGSSPARPFRPFPNAVCRAFSGASRSPRFFQQLCRISPLVPPRIGTQISERLLLYAWDTLQENAIDPLEESKP